MVNSISTGEDETPHYPEYYPNGMIWGASMFDADHDNKLADYAAAIDIIPKGVFIDRGRLSESGQVDKHTKQPNGSDLYLWDTDRHVRPPKYLIPALFVAGECAVEVFRQRWREDPVEHHPPLTNAPLGAATAMYAAECENMGPAPSRGL